MILSCSIGFFASILDLSIQITSSWRSSFPNSPAPLWFLLACTWYHFPALHQPKSFSSRPSDLFYTKLFSVLILFVIIGRWPGRVLRSRKMLVRLVLCWSELVHLSIPGILCKLDDVLGIFGYFEVECLWKHSTSSVCENFLGSPQPLKFSIV